MPESNTSECKEATVESLHEGISTSDLSNLENF